MSTAVTAVFFAVRCTFRAQVGLVVEPMIAGDQGQEFSRKDSDQTGGFMLMKNIAKSHHVNIDSMLSVG
jgi:hypothetical protein